MIPKRFELKSEPKFSPLRAILTWTLTFFGNLWDALHRSYFSSRSVASHLVCQEHLQRLLLTRRRTSRVLLTATAVITTRFSFGMQDRSLNSLLAKGPFRGSRIVSPRLLFLESLGFKSIAFEHRSLLGINMNNSLLTRRIQMPG